MPYRIDIDGPPPNAFDLLVNLGALEIEPVENGLAAILPDAVAKDTLTEVLGTQSVGITPVRGRDNGSTWLLNTPAIHVGGAAIKLADSGAFGTGRHPTTALCVRILEDILAADCPESILDVGTGSGILALAALALGVPQALGLDIDIAALDAAAENARLNRLADRFRLLQGGPEVAKGQWPLVVANVLAAPLMNMAPVLVQRVAKRGRLILSGIPCSLEHEVAQAYGQFGMQQIELKTRAGWTALVLHTSW